MKTEETSHEMLKSEPHEDRTGNESPVAAALMLMKQALSLLDQADEGVAAARLQHPIETLS